MRTGQCLPERASQVAAAAAATAAAAASAAATAAAAASAAAVAAYLRHLVLLAEGRSAEHGPRLCKRNGGRNETTHQFAIGCSRSHSCTWCTACNRLSVISAANKRGSSHPQLQRCRKRREDSPIREHGRTVQALKHRARPRGGQAVPLAVASTDPLGRPGPHHA